MTTNERSIWSLKQNHPELVVLDCKDEFGLSDIECQRLREILMERGVNKWLFARRKFIKLKHEIKIIIPVLQRNKKDYDPELRKTILNIYEKMQRIAKMPRWVEWSPVLHKKMKSNEYEIKIKGKYC